MNQELDYAEMLEIPVSTVNVVKKKSFFKRKHAAEQPAPQPEELKEMVVDTVNERVGAYVYAEDLSEPAKPEKVKLKDKFSGAAAALKDKSGKVLFIEAVAIGLIAVAIFVTNIFMPNSAINTFLGMITNTTPAEASEPAYSELKLSPVVSELSDAEISVSDSGVISFTAETSVYPVYGGTISRVYEDSGVYTVEIAHTSAFTSVITGLTNAYYGENTKVAANLPVGYSDGSNEVRVSLYNGGTLLNCVTVTDEVPVWVS